MRSDPERRIWISLALLVALLLVLSAVLLALASWQERRFASAHARELEYHLSSIATISRVQRELRAVERLVPGRPATATAASRDSAATALEVTREGLSTLVEMQARLGKPDFDETVRRAAAQHARLLDVLQRGPTDLGGLDATAGAALSSLGLSLDQLARLHNQIYTAEQERYENAARREQSLLLALLSGGGLVALLLCGFFTVQIRGALRRLAAADDALRALNRDLERRVEARTLALHETQEQLLRAERLATVGRLTATISHELRNPLGTIQASAHLLRADVREPVPRVDRAFARIERSIDRCIAVIGQLVAYTRGHDAQVSSVRLDDLVRSVVAEQSLPAGVERVLDLGCDAHVNVDPELLRAAIVNVVDNARQAMQEDRAATAHRLVVSTRRTGDAVEIRFTDTGPGVPAAIRDEMFEPLVSGRSFGVGLGLPLVKDVVEQHGGRVDVADARDGGTVVTLSLPAHAPDRKTTDDSSAASGLRGDIAR